MGKVNVLKDSLGRQSDLGGHGVLRDVHSYPDHSLRVKDNVSVIKEHFDNFTVEYNIDSLPTKICYYVGITSHKTEIGVIADVAGSLNNKYFFLYSARDNTKFHVWYNVDGGGTDPAPIDSIGIEINISSGDSASIVSLATYLVFSGVTLQKYFVTVRRNAVLEITTKKLGEALDTTDVNTTFVVSNTSGTSDLVNKVNIGYNGTNPIWEGQELKGHTLNLFTGKFENKSIVADIANNTAPFTDVETTLKDVTTTATLLAVGVSNKEGRRSITIQTKNKTLYFDYNNAVTSGNNGTGFKLTSGSYATITLGPEEELYGITSSGTAKVVIAEMK